MNEDSVQIMTAPAAQDNQEKLQARPEETPLKVQPRYYEKIIENKTARTIKIKCLKPNSDEVLVIQPFGTRRIQEEAGEPVFDYARWEKMGLVEVREIQLNAALSGVEAVAYGCALPLAIIFTLLLVVFSVNWVLLILLAIAACFIVGTFIYKRRARLVKVFRPLSLTLVGLIVIAAGAVCPAATIIYFSFGQSFVAPSLTQWLTPAAFGRVIQIAFIVIAALLPALLYFLFDRQKVNIVRREFYRQLVVLDTRIHTSGDAEDKYGHLINEVYGDKGARYYLGSVGLPIVISTVLITLGWLMILLPIRPAPDMNLERMFLMFVPRPTVMNFGFLGAYFFAITMVFRRYVRSDLTPKAYNHITVRLLITTVLVWVLSALPEFAAGTSEQPTPGLLIFAFMVGVIPEIGLTVIQEFARKTVGKFNDSLLERDPLTNLEGINLYDRARLSEEGVDNIENLAHHNLYSLLVQTHIPVQRLVDMFDQAILYLHLRDKPAGATAARPASTTAAESTGQPSGATTAKPVSTLVADGLDQAAAMATESNEGRSEALLILRSYGVRTATDLIQVCAVEPDQPGEPAMPHLDFLSILKVEQPDLVNRIHMVLCALDDDDWMPELRNWRSQFTPRDELIIDNPAKFFEMDMDYAEAKSVDEKSGKDKMKQQMATLAA